MTAYPPSVFVPDAAGHDGEFLGVAAGVPGWEAITAAWPGLFTLVAAADATSSQKAAADFVCDGTADDVQINAALSQVSTAALPSGGYTIHGGLVLLIGQQFKIAAPILHQTGCTFSGTAKSYTTIVADNGTTIASMIKLNGVNVERTVVENLSLNGNLAAATSGDGISYDNTAGSFQISPDPIHRIRHVDIRNCSGSGITDGTNCRGSIAYDVRIQGCAQHGVQAIGSDSKWSQVSVIACGTDDGAMTYHGYNVTGANAQFVLCKAAFQRGRGWLFDTVRGSATSCQAQDNYGAGLDIGANQNGCVFMGWVSDSNGMFPQAGIAGSDSGIYAQGGFFTLIGTSGDRGFATGNRDTGGAYGSPQAYGMTWRNDFAASCTVSLTCRGNKTDTVTGGRVAAGDNHIVYISGETSVSQVVYVNLPLAAGGTFTLTDPDSGNTTAPITFSATGSTLAANIQAALRAIAPFSPTNVNATTGNFSYQSKVTLASSLANLGRTPLTINGSSLTGVGASAAAVVILGVSGGARTSEMRLGHGPLYLNAQNFTPTDALISPGQVVLYEDATTHNLMARRKKADGTLVTHDLGAGA